MLKQRLIYGIIIGAFFVGLILLDSYAAGGWPLAAWSTPPGFFLAILSLLVIPVAVWEMRGLLARQNVHISLWITIAAAILCMLWPWLEQVGEAINQQYATVVDASLRETTPGWYDALPPDQAQRFSRIASSPWLHVGNWFRSVKPHYLVPTILAFSLVAAIVQHARKHKVEGAMANAGGTLLAITYLGVLPGFFLPICMTHSAWMFLAICAVVKSADIGAYTTGRLIGKHKLIPWLSPGKTVEGFFGGLFFAGVVGAVVAAIVKNNPSIGERDVHWIHLTLATAVLGGGLSGILLGAVGQIGDLLESLLKRDAGVKDSGAVPGFGGVLDILDSPLLAAPVAYWLLKIVLHPL